MDNKPIISYFTSNTCLVEKLKENIITNLPEECIEWRRSYGRSTKKVFLTAQMLPFHEIQLKNHSFDVDNSSLFNQCFLHTFWFECPNVEIYKSTIREEVLSWINTLSENGIVDWLVIVIDNNEKKKHNKSKILSRTRIIDKLKADFPSSIKDVSEKCICLHNPLKNNSFNSYQVFLVHLRFLFFKSYSRQLGKYEDWVRSQREKRNNVDWNFFKFFILQEELAFAFELLSLFDDALVQYDELDALFSQFVINSHVIQVPPWLKSLSERVDSWHGLCLCRAISHELRQKIKNSTASLLELRNYLFSRQCELLLLQHRPWEAASKCLSFLQNCVYELNILKVNLPPGAVACWVFLSALEILQKCERYSDSSQMQLYSRYTVGLWAYARKKLEELGHFCNLMPDQKFTSDSIHRVANLVLGMGLDPHSGTASPQEKLKEALSKPEAFLKVYLEFSELAISTYKHISQFRFARLIGRELAFLYMKMNKHQQSISFFLDMEKVFLSERWFTLLTNIREQILNCFKVLNDTKKILQYSFLLASSSCLSENQRKNYLKTILEVSHKVSLEKPFINTMEEIFSIVEIKLKTESLIATHSKVDVVLTLDSNILEPFHCKKLSFGLKIEPLNEAVNKKNIFCPHLNHHNSNIKPIFETYHNSAKVGIKCPNLNQCFKRIDQISSFDKEQLIQEYEVFEYEDSFVGENINIQSGFNEFVLTYEPLKCGHYTIDAICLEWIEGIFFVQRSLPSHVCFPVISEEPSLNFFSSNSFQPLPLFSGINQNVTIQFNSGSYTFSAQTSLNLISSSNLKIAFPKALSSFEEVIFSNQLTFNLPETLSPFQYFDIPLVIWSSFSNQTKPTGSDHEISVSYTNMSTNEAKLITTTIHFISPFMSNLKLHTCHKRKFIEIAITGLIDEKFILFDQVLEVNEQVKEKIFVKCLSSFGKGTIKKNQVIHYIWELFKDDHDICELQFMFSLRYQQHNLKKSLIQMYKCNFKLENFDTLYTIKANIDPKNSEFCRVGALSNLNIIIEKVGRFQVPPAIMYETVVDSTLWNLNGQTAGVIETKNQDKFILNFEALPLTSGHLPIPNIRLFKYINFKKQKSIDSDTAFNCAKASPIEFEKGQIYNWSGGCQVNVLPSGLLIS